MTGMPRDWARSRARVLSPKRSSVSGRGPMKTRPSSAHRWAKPAFSDEEAVAGMDAVAAGWPWRLDQGVDVEIGAHGIARVSLRLGQRPRVGRDAGMQGKRVDAGVDGDRLDAQSRRRARDADGDFTPVGNQYTFEQRLTPPTAAATDISLASRPARGVVACPPHSHQGSEILSPPRPIEACPEA